MKKLLRMLLLAGLVLIASLGVRGEGPSIGQAQSGNLPLERWLPSSGEDVPASPRLHLLRADENQIDLQAEVPGVWAVEVREGDEIFSRLFGDGFSSQGEIGLPGLPVLRGEIEIPFGATVVLELIQAEFTQINLADVDLHPIYPLQPPLIKQHGAQERQGFTIDRDFYNSEGFYPSNLLELGETYHVRGRQVQTIEIRPAAYDPAAGALRLYSQVTLRMHLSGGSMQVSEQIAQRYASNLFDDSLRSRIINFDLGRAPFEPLDTAGYLIITADDFYDSIQPFVQIQEARGFTVTTIRLSEIPGGTSKEHIKAYIQEAYDSWPLPPSYLLLMGDTDTIEAWSSTTSGGRYTDLYYATMDGQDDYVPDLGRGRFPVRTEEQAVAMVDKYVAYFQLTGLEPWVKKAGFIATCDLYTIAEGTHNYVVDNHTLPEGYTGIFPENPQPGGDKIYCITYGGNTQVIREAANDGRWALVYSGHGSEVGWADGAVSFSQNDVRGLTGLGFYPFVASHACVTGSFGSPTVPESFIETWVLQENKGALVGWAASHNTYWYEDDILERKMWDKLFEEGSPTATVAAMTDYALAQTAYFYPSMGKYYWEAYNVMGDPSVRIFREPEQPSFTLNVTPSEHEVCSTGTLTSEITIHSLLGYSETVYLEHGVLPVGVLASFDPESAQAPYNSVMEIEVLADAESGDHILTVTAIDQIQFTIEKPVNLRVVEAPPPAPVLVNPPDGSQNQPFLPIFSWEETPLTSGYRVQVDRSPLFEEPLVDESLAATSFIPNEPLDGGRCYWWRVQGDNACGTSQWGGPDRFATISLGIDFSDDIETGDGAWSHGATIGSDQWVITSAHSHSPTHSWHTPAANSISDTWLRLKDQIEVVDGSTLKFWHRYVFEGTSIYYDGSVLEISIDGGVSWTDLGPYITANGYTGVISTGYNNPLGGRQAWTGSQQTWTQVSVDLSSYAGQNILVRWRLGTDTSIGTEGWYIDDVEITSPLPPQPAPVLLAITPFEGLNLEDTAVQIEGVYFFDLPALKLGDTWLKDVSLVSDVLIEAIVPAGMALGVYDLTLFNGDCQTDTLSDAFTVLEGIAPFGDFIFTEPARIGTALAVTATVAGPEPISYSWDFGGEGEGVNLDTPTPAFTYSEPGTFTITLEAENTFGVLVLQKPVTVLGLPPQGDFSFESPARVGVPVVFQATLTVGPSAAFYWDFGGPGTGGDEETISPWFTYAEAGVYTVRLSVIDEYGELLIEKEIVVEPPLTSLFLPIVHQAGASTGH
jgi:hypothetical protein